MQPRRRPNAAKLLRNTLITALACLLPVTFSSCMMGSASPDGGNPPPPPVSAAISICDNGTPDCPPATSFAVNTARDLIITVNWQNLPPGNHVQTLEILIPAGGPFQVTQATFNAASSPTGSFTTTRIFPVAATWITQRQITGNWTVVASLDGQQIASQVVQLNP